jgi:hypothetical protein
MTRERTQIRGMFADTMAVQPLLTKPETESIGLAMLAR